MKSKAVLPLLAILCISMVQAQSQNLTVDVNSHSSSPNTFSVTGDNQETYSTSIQVTLANKAGNSRSVDIYAGVCGQGQKYVWDELAAGCAPENSTFVQIFNPTEGLIECSDGVESANSCRKSIVLQPDTTESTRFNITVPENSESKIYNTGVYTVDSDLGVVHIERRDIQTRETGPIKSILVYLDNLIKNIL